MSDNAAGMLLEVRHDTHYEYDLPVSLAHHLAHLQPLADAHQALHSFTLTVEPEPGHRRDSADAYGNVQTHFSLVQPHRELTVQATSLVKVLPRFAALRADTGRAWEEAAAGLRYVAGGHVERAVEFVFPSRYVPALAALSDYAAPWFTPGRPVAEAALALMHGLHADFSYQSQSTAVDTPLAEVLVRRRGVCQDFAHLLIGALRSRGLPARYVSGYLLTGAPDEHAPEHAPMLGADASHAWAQVWCPGTAGVPEAGAPVGQPDGGRWLDLDPTNDLVPGATHVRVAVGRDFGDVTPLRGVIRGGGRHRLAVSVRTRLVPQLAATDAPDSARGLLSP